MIVGGGPAAAHLLSELTRRRRTIVGRVVVIERTGELGTGLPYGESAAETHTLGRVNWRRRARGADLRTMFVDAVAELGQRGCEVIVQTMTQAKQLVRRPGAWEVETDRGRVVAASAVLATGPWHVHRLAHLERAVDWRWDVRRLGSIRDDEDVVVLGTSQSAIDLATVLASGKRVVTLASRRGLLPSVWAPLIASRTPPGAAHQLDRLRAQPGVRLAEIFEAARRDVQALGGDPAGPARCADGVATLARDLQAAIEASDERREIPWQAVLWATVPIVFDLFPRLVAEDRIALAPIWYPCLRHLEAVHIDVARQVLELVAAGRVRICALGEAEISEDSRGITATGPLGEVRAHRIIDARGHDPHIERSDDTFLRSALGAGLITPSRVPFLEEPARTPLVTGGVWVDPATFQVRDAAGASATSLFALGPLTMGQFPIYLGLWALRRAATLIVKQLSAAGASRGTPGRAP